MDDAGTAMAAYFDMETDNSLLSKHHRRHFSNLLSTVEGHLDLVRKSPGHLMWHLGLLDHLIFLHLHLMHYLLRHRSERC